MKNLFFTGVFSFLFLTFHAQEVNFFQGTWAEVTAKAKAENKPIYIDAYTDWCYWCKVMDTNTFSNPIVVKYLNENTIPYKVNCEKGEGQAIAAKFKIRGFPSNLVLNSNAELTSKWFGYISDLDRFLSKVKNGVETIESPFSFSPELDPGFPQFYLDKFYKEDKKPVTEQSVVDAWLNEQEDLTSEVSWAVMSTHYIAENHKAFFLENYAVYQAKYGIEETERRIYSFIREVTRNAAKEENIDLLEDTKELYRFVVDDESEIEGRFKMALFNYYSDLSDYPNCIQVANELIDTRNFDFFLANTINSLCWSIYEDSTVSADLVAACLPLMKKVIAHNPNEYAMLDTYAAIFFKVGNKKKAIQYAQRAIKAGENAGEDVASTQEMLNEIRLMH